MQIKITKKINLHFRKVSNKKIIFSDYGKKMVRGNILEYKFSSFHTQNKVAEG